MALRDELQSAAAAVAAPRPIPPEHIEAVTAKIRLAASQGRYSIQVVAADMPTRDNAADLYLIASYFRTEERLSASVATARHPGAQAVLTLGWAPKEGPQPTHPRHGGDHECG